MQVYKIKVKLSFFFNSEKTAEAYYNGIYVDNKPFKGTSISTRIYKETLEVESESESIGTLKNTVDDIIACVEAIRKTLVL
ncbi:MAG TPA: KEOPS complex subunit Pcc1 [Methanofastidiosum sp.]|nr:KEOPS complex subunit Pcc1 [Methanofastidiosum sp.]